MGTKSPRYFCVLRIVSNFVFTMLLICQVTKIWTYGFTYYLCIVIGSIVIYTHICIYKYIYIYIYIHIYIHIHIYIYICMYVCMYIYGYNIITILISLSNYIYN